MAPEHGALSLVAVVLWLPALPGASAPVCVAVTAAAAVGYTFAGVWAGNMAEMLGPRPVVACADETVGQWFALLAVLPGAPWSGDSPGLRPLPILRHRQALGHTPQRVYGT